MERIWCLFWMKQPYKHLLRERGWEKKSLFWTSEIVVLPRSCSVWVFNFFLTCILNQLFSVREEVLRDLACHRVDIFLTTWITRAQNKKKKSHITQWKARFHQSQPEHRAVENLKWGGTSAVHLKRHILQIISFRIGSITAEKSYKQSFMDAGTPVLAPYTGILGWTGSATKTPHAMGRNPQIAPFFNHFLN